MGNNTRQTSASAASRASAVLRSGTASRAAKSVAASTLAQTGNRDQTGSRAASNAGRTLSASNTTKSQRSAAASALAQTPSRKSR